MVYAMSEDECGFYKVDQKENIHPKTRLTNHNFLNATVTHSSICFNKCAENCFCESFNVYGERCKLSSTTKEDAPDDYKNETDCTYYDMGRVQRSEVSISTTV